MTTSSPLRRGATLRSSSLRMVLRTILRSSLLRYALFVAPFGQDFVLSSLRSTLSALSGSDEPSERQGN